MNHIIYRDYIVNQRFFIYCGLACAFFFFFWFCFEVEIIYTFYKIS